MIDQTWKEMYKAAKEVQNSCKISNHMEAGGIAATVYQHQIEFMLEFV